MASARTAASRRLFPLIPFLAGAGLLPAAPDPGARPAPALAASGFEERAGVELVLVPVSVRDAAGDPIAGLGRNDFSLFESGVRQEIATFDREATPVSLVFGVDSSGSMNDYLAFVKAAAIRFVERVPPVFAVSLVSFAEETTTRSTFKDSRRHLFYELGQLRANGGGTAILDATRQAIDRVAQRPGRRAVVLFTDGEENAVAPQEQDAAIASVVRRARAADVTVYYVGYGWVAKTRMLETVAAQTGGVYLAAGHERKITQAFDAIARALDSQYTLGYVPRPGPPGEWRPIAVAVARATGQVAARKGYFVPAAAAPIRP